MASINFADVVKNAVANARKSADDAISKHGIPRSDGSGKSSGSQSESGAQETRSARWQERSSYQPGQLAMTGQDQDNSGQPGGQASTMASTGSDYGSSGTGNVVYEPTGNTPGKKEYDPTAPWWDNGRPWWEDLRGFVFGDGALADTSADEIGGYDVDGTVAAEGDNDYVATVNGQIQDAIESGDMFAGADWEAAGIDPADADWTSIAYMPAETNVYGQLYGTETRYDENGNPYTVLSEEAENARMNDLFYLYSLEGNQDIFGSNWTTDRDEFNAHYRDVVSTEELLTDLAELGYLYVGGDDEAIRSLSYLTYLSGTPVYLGSGDTYDMSQMYAEDPETYLNNLDAMYANAVMESAGLGDIVAYQNGEYDGDLSIDELQEQAAARLGWKQDDLNALMDNENLTYTTGDGWGRNTTDHRGDAIADQYLSSLDDEWLTRSSDPTWNSADYEAPLPVKNQADNVFAVYDGMSY